MIETKTLIPLTVTEVNGEQQQTVNARELHAFLEIGKDFSTWVKDRIEKFDFVENADFVKLPAKSSSPISGSQPKIEYFLSLSMAKELSMIERNAKGKQARLYFIGCERIAKEKANPYANRIPKSYADALRLAAEMADQTQRLTLEKKALEDKVEKDAPKVAFTDGVMAGNTDIPSTAAAKVLGIGPRKFIDWLRINGFLYKQSNQAMQSAIDAGYMVVRFAKINHSDYTEDKPYAHITGKGLYYFYQRLRKDGLIAVNEKLELTA